MTWFHSTPSRPSRRKQHHRRTPTLKHHDPYDDDNVDDDYISAVPSDRSPTDTELDQPPNDDDDDAPSGSATNSERTNNVRKETAASSSCSAMSDSPNDLPRQSISQPHNNSYMNIAQFPVFRGGGASNQECPFAHLSRFVKVCRANNVASIEMMARIFPVTLEDEAALWYDLNIEPHELSWEEIKSSFTHAYGKTEVPEELRSQLMTINQGEDEPVRSYFLRLQWILRKWPGHGLSDDLLKGVFVDGLRDDFQEWMAPQKPRSLSEALRLAFCFEQVKSVRGLRRNPPDAKKCGFCEGLHEEKGCEIRARMKELWMKSKEEEGKGMLIGLERSLNAKSEGVKELERSISMVSSTSCVVGKNSNNEMEEGGELGLKRKSQCQCGKHQCWKKNLERNNSNVSGNLKGG